MADTLGLVLLTYNDNTFIGDILEVKKVDGVKAIKVQSVLGITTLLRSNDDDVEYASLHEGNPVSGVIISARLQTES